MNLLSGRHRSLPSAPLRWTAGLLLAISGLAGCGPSSASRNEPQKIHYPVRVVCTTGQIGDILKNVGRKHVRVEVLMGPGVDPHLHKSSPGDRKKLNAADIIFYNGMHLEGRMADMLLKMARLTPTFAVTERLQEANDERLREPEEFKGQYDPHLWFNVELWSECASYAAERLIERDPDHAEDYRKNAAAYVDGLKELHTWCGEQLAQIPKQQRVLVTAHDAFGYFGDAYDIEVYGLQGVSTASKADIPTIKRLAEMLAERNIKAVFVESSVPKRNVASLIQQCKAIGHTVSIGGELFSDAMGDADSPEGTYEGMVRHNVRTIVDALK